MKTLSTLFIGILSMSTIYAQDISDALRYSQNEIQGTARYRALSGAFGALGGDMSAVSANPAGSAVFSQSHASLTLSNISANNDTKYFNGATSKSDSNFDINQAGAAFVFASNSNSPWKKFTFSVAYDKTNSFEDQWNAVGIGNTSIDQYFLDITKNLDVPFSDIKLRDGEFIEEAYADIGTIPNVGYDYQQVFLGYWGGVINPVNTDDNTNDNNIDYVSILNGAPYKQQYSFSSTGYNGKVAFNFATQYEDNLYFGINLNSHFIDYERATLFTENDDVHFDNTLSTTGNGFSFQLGSIYKISNEFRVGLTYDSPIWYTIKEEGSQSINSDLADSDISFINDIINVYPEYKLQTPGKFTGSLAYIFGKQGLISFDYSIKDYSNTKFTPKNDTYFANKNDIIANTFTNAATYRIGGEYKVKQLSLRGGYRFEESPYKDGVTVGDLTGYSLGLGYNFGNFKVDLTYDQWNRTDKTPLYNVGLTDAASVDRTNNNVSLSFSFNL